jgi:hypothetical protein
VTSASGTASRKEQRLGGSFRDPAGFVFKAGDTVYRQVSAVYRPDYERLMGSGLYETLTGCQLLIPHSEAYAPEREATGAYKVLRPELIPFLSYPYEWCFEQLKDAALATLTIQRMALEHGMSLKDGSAYNIQFRGCRPVLIDTLSFEAYEDGQPWTGYRQFCQHFLAPLALMSKVDVRLGLLSRSHIDGVPLDLASRMLPAQTWLRPSLLLHLHVHAQAQKRFSVSRTRPASRGIGRRSLLGLVDNLRAAIDGLTYDIGDTAWADYDDHTNYSAEARCHKEELVQTFLAATRPNLVWDLGANGGRFSRIAAKMLARSIAFDSDYGATEINYRACRAAGESRILPLVVDLANPSPALGWAHEERSGWTERGPADLVMALALIHHLAIGNNVPLAGIATLLQRVGRQLIIEFVPKTDSQVQRLLANRADVFTDYSQAAFERAFAQCFRIHRAEPVRDSQRVMYLMEKC